VNPNEKAVAEVLAKYQDALNQSDTDAVIKLYAPDGVFMPQNSPSSVGAGEVRNAYDAVFKTIKLTVKFNVDEVVEMAPNWVFARTNSAGTVKVLATGVGGPEANQELFLFQKVDGEWKIARYCFSTTNPAPLKD
jgi:uncharacterized protein (TIGR02246 family)